VIEGDMLTSERSDNAVVSRDMSRDVGVTSALCCVGRNAPSRRTHCRLLITSTMSVVFAV